MRNGGSDKVCQLTGDVDWETGRPTAARTLANFGLDAVDLGFPVEHAGKLLLLFGDSWPPHHPGGPAGELPPDDAVGVVLRQAPPDDDGKCLELRINEKSGPAPIFAPATIVGPTPVKQGFFNVPSGGVSAVGGLYGFFWTDHCSAPAHLEPSLEAPLRRPPANAACPETDGRNSIGRGVMARSDDDGRTFGRVAPLPTGFVYATAVNAELLADLPEDQRRGVFIFAVPRYRASVPYLAKAPVETLADPATWRFFTGRTANGQPSWATYEDWQRGAAAGMWKPPGDAGIFVPVVPAGYCVGEFSITWNRPLGRWLMLHQCARRVFARIAAAPWGSWSTPTEILGDGDGVGCRLVMLPQGCGNRRDYWPGKHGSGKFVPGGFYAPYVLDRYTTAGGPGRRSTIYWLVSTWNPYEVSVMRTTLELGTR